LKYLFISNKLTFSIEHKNEFSQIVMTVYQKSFVSIAIKFRRIFVSAKFSHLLSFTLRSIEDSQVWLFQTSTIKLLHLHITLLCVNNGDQIFSNFSVVSKKKLQVIVRLFSLVQSWCYSFLYCQSNSITTILFSFDCWNDKNVLLSFLHNIEKKNKWLNYFCKSWNSWWKITIRLTKAF
jgi:hypothetical protein